MLENINGCFCDRSTSPIATATHPATKFRNVHHGFCRATFLTRVTTIGAR